VQFADFGFGTVVGAVIAGAVAIFLDQRRRRDETKNRFLDEKRRGYMNVILALDMMAGLQLVHTEFAPLLRKLESGEDLDPTDIKASESFLVFRGFGLDG
jgi:hypothetical protein